MKGNHNQPCVGPCILGKDITVHPVYLRNMGPFDEPYCSTLEWTNDEGTKIYYDTCSKPIDASKLDKRDLIISYGIPNFGFDCKEFLRHYYNLYSFESILEWLTQENNNIYTKLRIINCGWSAFVGHDDEQNQEIINDQLIEFYMNIIKKIWIKEIYSNIFQYVSVDKNNIYFKKNNDTSKDHKIEKINFIMEKFNNRSFIYNILKSYIDTNKSKWKNIKNHNNELKKYYIDCIINKIKITLPKK